MNVTVLSKIRMKVGEVIGGAVFVEDNDGQWRRVVRVEHREDGMVRFITLHGPIGWFPPGKTVDVLT